MATYNDKMEYSQAPHYPDYLTDITDVRVARWLARSHAVAASGDNRFADDGETLQQAKRDKPLKPAAVLVLLVAAPDAVPTIVFTQRTAHLTDHAGQISFPGGRMEAHDANAAATALREAEEEAGIAAEQVTILGELPAYTTGTGYLVTPVVAWTNSRPRYQPDAFEVAEIFEVPANYLLHAANHRHEQAMYKGRLRQYYAVPFQHRYIWGATAGMLITFAQVAAVAEGQHLAPPRPMEADSA
jgi:8-oxo-dGTP pyrophosphatase MutT (NUDIX family)